jgi:hypothetical protein
MFESDRRRRQRRSADVSKASRFIPSSGDPHSDALRTIVVVLVVDLSVVAGAGSCWCCHANLIAYRRIEKGIKRDALLTYCASERGPGEVSVPMSGGGGRAALPT